jgi:hypothetical protein
VENVVKRRLPGRTNEANEANEAGERRQASARELRSADPPQGRLSTPCKFRGEARLMAVLDGK